MWPVRYHQTILTIGKAKGEWIAPGSGVVVAASVRPRLQCAVQCWAAARSASPMSADVAAIGKDSRRPVRYLRIYGVRARDWWYGGLTGISYYHFSLLKILIYILLYRDRNVIPFLIYKLSGITQHMARLLGFSGIDYWLASMQGYSRKLNHKTPVRTGHAALGIEAE